MSLRLLVGVRIPQMLFLVVNSTVACEWFIFHKKKPVQRCGRGAAQCRHSHTVTNVFWRKCTPPTPLSMFSRFTTHYFVSNENLKKTAGFSADNFFVVLYKNCLFGWILNDGRLEDTPRKVPAAPRTCFCNIVKRMGMVFLGLSLWIWRLRIWVESPGW